MIAIRRLTPDDVDFGMLLKQQSGWNQTRTDWRRYLHLQPDGCFLAESSGQPAGTVVVIVFESVAWVAMMLVEASLRGRGLGRALMERALAFAAEQGAATVRLDATALGQPLYERLGFAADYAVIRYGGMPLASLPAAAKLPHVAVDDIASLDHAAAGCDRRRLLTALWEEQPGWGVVHDGQALGYYAARPGSGATQIGPCVADVRTGLPLLRDAFQRYAGQPVFVDLPEPNPPALVLAQSVGLSPRRRFQRMTRGPRPTEQLELLWASSGPEKG